jgi:hypothetical protein
MFSCSSLEMRIALIVGFSGMGGIQSAKKMGGATRLVITSIAVSVGRKLSFSLSSGEARSARGAATAERTRPAAYGMIGLRGVITCWRD